MGLVNWAKGLFRKSPVLKVIGCGAVGTPTLPGRVIVDERAQGMPLLYTADTSAEAELLQQVLAEAGFHMEYIPSTTTGVFGIMGNCSIYVKPEEYDDARLFLAEYLSAPPLNPDSQQGEA